MKKIIWGILAITVLITGAIFVAAQRSGGKAHDGFAGRRGGDRIASRMLRGLDLSDDQKAKVKAIEETSEAAVAPLREQLQVGHKTIVEIGSDGTFDEAKTTALANEQAGIIAKLIVEQSKAKAEIFAVLTDEQRAKAVQIRQHFGPGEKPRGHRSDVGEVQGSE